MPNLPCQYFSVLAKGATSVDVIAMFLLVTLISFEANENKMEKKKKRKKSEKKKKNTKIIQRKVFQAQERREEIDFRKINVGRFKLQYYVKSE